MAFEISNIFLVFPCIFAGNNALISTIYCLRDKEKVIAQKRGEEKEEKAQDLRKKSFDVKRKINNAGFE